MGSITARACGGTDVKPFQKNKPFQNKLPCPIFLSERARRWSALRSALNNRQAEKDGRPNTAGDADDQRLAKMGRHKAVCHLRACADHIVELLSWCGLRSHRATDARARTALCLGRQLLLPLLAFSFLLQLPLRVAVRVIKGCKKWARLRRGCVAC